MKRKFLAGLCALVMLVSILPSAAALTGEARRAADTLSGLGVVNGTGSGYALDAVPTRVQAAAILVRLAGMEAQAKKGSYASKFTDVPAWATGTVAFAAAKGWVKGTAADTFSPNAPVSANAWFAFLLRMLGYSDAKGDFAVSDAALFARRIGLTSRDYYTGDKTFTRGELFRIAADALSFRYKGSDDTVLDRLISRGAVTRQQAAGLGLLNPLLTPRQIYDRCSSAVFQLDFHTTPAGTVDPNADADGDGQPDGEPDPDINSSGFFIHESGVAVTNFHAIDGALRGTATLLTGEQFPVQDVLYFDRKIDIAVIRISRTSTEGKTTSAFAALEMVGASEVYPGDDVYAIGNPLGDGISFSDGIVSDAARAMSEYALPCIVNTASISQGSSGGALLNAYGQVVGITTGAYVYGNNMYLAVPVDPAMDVDVTKAGWTMSQFYYDLPFLENN